MGRWNCLCRAGEETERQLITGVLWTINFVFDVNSLLLDDEYELLPHDNRPPPKPSPNTGFFLITIFFDPPTRRPSGPNEDGVLFPVASMIAAFR